MHEYRDDIMHATLRLDDNMNTPIKEMIYLYCMGKGLLFQVF